MPARAGGEGGWRSPGCVVSWCIGTFNASLQIAEFGTQSKSSWSWAVRDFRQRSGLYTDTKLWLKEGMTGPPANRTRVMWMTNRPQQVMWQNFSPTPIRSREAAYFCPFLRGPKIPPLTQPLLTWQELGLKATSTSATSTNLQNSNSSFICLCTGKHMLHCGEW